MNDAGLRAEEAELSTPSYGRRLWEVFRAFLPLGWIAFGGPQTQIALLQERFVEGRRWLDGRQFMELLGLGQGLPGSTVTQMVVAVGAARAGPVGGLASFFCFLHPPFIVMTLAGLGVSGFLTADNRPDWFDGLGAAAAALMAASAWRLGRAVVNTRLTMGIMLFSATAAILWLHHFVFPAVLASGGLVTAIALRGRRRQDAEDDSGHALVNLGISPAWGGALLALFLGLFAGLSVARVYLDWQALALAESFYRTGSLVFGTGQVVPMMLTEVVEPGWVTDDEFLDGFALMLALPGPVFTFSAYLGAVAWGVPGAALTFAGLFLPGVLLIYAALPFWERLRGRPLARAILTGVNAAAIGLVVVAAFLLWERGVESPKDAVMALLSFGAATFFRVPAPLVIVGALAVGFLLHLAGM